MDFAKCTTSSTGLPKQGGELGADLLIDVLGDVGAVFVGQKIAIGAQTVGGDHVATQVGEADGGRQSEKWEVDLDGSCRPCPVHFQLGRLGRFAVRRPLVMNDHLLQTTQH